MKNLSLKILIASIALVLGVAAVFWSNYLSERKNNYISDQKNFDAVVYSVTFSELTENLKKYDGKIVRVKAIYSYIKDAPSYLFDYDSDKKVRISCEMDNASCSRMSEKAITIQSADNFSFLAQLDMIGRFKANVEVEKYYGSKEKEQANLIEILEIKNIERVRKPTVPE